MTEANNPPDEPENEVHLHQARNAHKIEAARSPPPDVMERRYLILVVPLVISCCIYFATRSSNTHRVPATLLKAFVVFRHGSRSPKFTYLNDKFDPLNTNIWPEGPERLTKKGKVEAYKLGERLRERYGSFLGSYYISEELQAHTTLTDRTLMSGQLVLASLYPPVGYQIWNENLHWQPIPIYPEYISNGTSGGRCPRFGVEAKASLGKVKHTMNLEQKEVFAEILKNAGEPNSKAFEVFVRVWDSVYFQEKANLPLPEWIRNYYPDPMKHTALTFITGFLTGSQVQKKLILYNYAQALRNFLLADDRRKMEIHSWHDINNILLMELLGIKIDHYPEPTSCLVVEMHNRRGSKFFEAFYYDSYKSKEPKQLEMACGMSCSEGDLEEIAIQLKLDNYTEVCQSGGSQGKMPDMFDKMLLALSV